jgi:hypothetical protein
VTRPECADNPDRWFSDAPDEIEEAKAICDRCPIRNRCAEAGRDEPWGTWGGLSTGERLGLMLLATPEPPPHEASRSCYSAGCRRPECCEANTRYIAHTRSHPAPVTRHETVDAWEQMTLAVTS